LLKINIKIVRKSKKKIMNKVRKSRTNTGCLPVMEVMEMSWNLKMCHGNVMEFHLLFSLAYFCWGLKKCQQFSVK
jgi:hypothetical protein